MYSKTMETMTIMYKAPNSAIKDLANQAFGYEGDDFRINWGSPYYFPRNYLDKQSVYRKFVFVENGTEEGQVVISEPPEWMSDSEHPDAHERILMSINVYVMEAYIVSGNIEHITLYMRPDQLIEEDKERIISQNKAHTELDLFEKCALWVFSNVIPKDRKNKAIHVIGMTESEYVSALDSLQSRKLVGKNNRLTKQGRTLIDELKILDIEELINDINSLRLVSNDKTIETMLPIYQQEG